MPFLMNTTSHKPKTVASETSSNLEKSLLHNCINHYFYINNGSHDSV